MVEAIEPSLPAGRSSLRRRIHATIALMELGYRENAVEDRSLLVVAFGGRVFGLEPSDGSIRWEHTIAYAGTIEVIVRHGRIYASSSQELHCLEYPSGRPLGRVVIPDRYKGRTTMLLERDRIYLGSGGEVSCFTLDGTPLWSQGFVGKGIGGVALAFPDNIRQSDDIGSS